ncbi:MAG: glycosyltransferase family 39 protein [Myxococcota bacterium]|nr:glycosyltransferase family 39 protein [Myxococcota bacterium]
MPTERVDTHQFLRGLMGPGAAALATLAIQLPFFRLWFAFMDEGHMVQFADMALKGGEFYRDATFYPLPGAFWLLAGAFDLFGASLLVSRWIVVLEFSIFVGLAYHLLRQMTSLPFAWLGVLALWVYRVWCFPHWQIYSYSTTSLLVLFASLLCLLHFMQTFRRRHLAAAGLLYGLGVLCKQDYGAAFLLGMGVCIGLFCLSVPRSRRLGGAAIWFGFLAPAALVGALTGFYFWQAGVLPDLIQFTVTNHFVGMGAYEYTSFPDLMPLWGQDVALRTRGTIANYMPGILIATVLAEIRTHPLFTDTAVYDILLKLFFYLPIPYLAVCILRLFWTRARLLHSQSDKERWDYLREAGLVSVAASLLALVWFNKPQDYLHLAVLYWPFILLGIVHVHALTRARPRWAWGVGILALAPALALVYGSISVALSLKNTHTAPLPGERAGLFALPADAAMISDVLEYVEEYTDENDRVAALPYFPIINFLAERMGPHRSAYILWPFPEIPDRDQKVIAAMEETQTDRVIYHFTQFESFDPVWEHAPDLFAYLVENFEMDRVFNAGEWGYKLAGLKRSPERAHEGVRIVPPGAEGLEIRIEESGPPRTVPPGSRPAYVREMLWPFRPVIALRASTGGRQTVLEVPIEVPLEPTRLVSAVGIHPQSWLRLPPSWVEFKIAIEGERGREVVFQRRLGPSNVLADRGWFGIDIPLDRWAGQRVQIEFIQSAERLTGANLWMGGWEIPRLVSGPATPPEALSDQAEDRT